MNKTKKSEWIGKKKDKTIQDHFFQIKNQISWLPFWCFCFFKMNFFFSEIECGVCRGQCVVGVFMMILVVGGSGEKKEFTKINERKKNT